MNVLDIHNSNNVVVQINAVRNTELPGIERRAAAERERIYLEPLQWVTHLRQVLEELIQVLHLLREMRARIIREAQEAHGAARNPAARRRAVVNIWSPIWPIYLTVVRNDRGEMEFRHPRQARDRQRRRPDANANIHVQQDVVENANVVTARDINGVIDRLEARMADLRILIRREENAERRAAGYA